MKIRHWLIPFVLSLALLALAMLGMWREGPSVTLAQGASDRNVYSQPFHSDYQPSGLADSQPRNCQAIHDAYPSWGSAYYTIDPDGDGGNPPLDAYCDMETDAGGWTVIDYNHAAGWQSYFGTWQVFDNNRMAQPTGAGFPSPSYEYWVHWFLLADSSTQFRISSNCQGVSSTLSTAQAYATTGNFYGCRWYNRNCDMDDATQECHTCVDNWGQTGPGTCSHLTKSTGSRDAIYEGYPFSCSFDWWNAAPSVGIAGQYCVAYRGPVQPAPEGDIDPATGGTIVYTDAQGLSTTIEVAPGTVTRTITLVFTPMLSPTYPLSPGLSFAGHAFDLETYCLWRVYLPLVLRDYSTVTTASPINPTAIRVLPAQEPTLSCLTAASGYVPCSITFQKPITITIRYSDADVTGINEANLRLYYWTGTHWEDAANTCASPSTYFLDPVGNVLTLPICHLSRFSMQG